MPRKIMNEPTFDPESAEIAHHSIFFSGIKERLISSGEISDYENLHSALTAIDAPESEKAIAEFIELFRSAAEEGFGRIKEEIAAQKDWIAELENRYMEADEDVPARIQQLYEDLAG